MNNSASRLLHTLIILISSMLFFSCGYGFLNFASVTGDLQIDFELTSDNPFGLNRVVYELTPPEGFASSIENNFSGTGAYTELNNATAGLWNIGISVFAGQELLLEDNYKINIPSGERIHLKIYCYWDGSSYSLSSDSWTETEDSGIPSQPVFSINETRFMPAVYENYYTGERKAGINIRILGSGFFPDLKTMRLEYPDGGTYSFGYLDYYSRALQFYHNVESNMIEIQRNLGSDYSALAGGYFFYLEDSYRAATEYDMTLAVDLDAAMPDLPSCIDNSIPQNYQVIPHSLLVTDDYDFEYSFDPAAGAGTRIVFILDRTTGTTWPAGDSIVVSNDTGFFNMPAATFSAGPSFELIAASVGFSTTTPTAYATAAGVSYSDLRSETLVASLYRMFGADTGFVYFKSVPFSIIN